MVAGAVRWLMERLAPRQAAEPERERAFDVGSERLADVVDLAAVRAERDDG